MQKKYLFNDSLLNNKKIVYYLVYTFCFAMISFVIFSPFLGEGKALIWRTDGIQQHYNALLYYRNWLRNIVYNICYEHKFEIPLWDMKIGYGADILTTLHYYVIGDPLNLLVGLVPKIDWVEEFYQIMILVRMYLSGVAFSYYCFEHDHQDIYVLQGTLIYVFSFWVIVGLRHPYFINPMIYFPLILLGIDRIYQKKKPWFYMIMLTIIMLSNFYFAYMICVLVFFYATAIYFAVERKINIKRVWYWVSRFLVYSLMSIAVSAIVLFPVIAATVATGRAGAENYVPAIYPLSYYLRFISGFMLGGTTYWGLMGYTAMGVIAVVALFLSSKKRLLKIMFLFLTFILLIPFAGHMMNGGSYVVNRYMWAYSLLVSYIYVSISPELTQIIRVHCKKFVVLTVLYAIFCFGVSLATGEKNLWIAIGIFAIGTFYLLLISKEKVKLSWHKNQIILCGLIILSLMYQGWEKFSPFGENYVEEFADKDSAYKELTINTASSILNQAYDNSVWRYDQLQTDEWKNVGMQQQVNGTSFYFSQANHYVNQFQRELYLNNPRDYWYTDLDGRTMLDVLLGVKYFILPSDKEGLLPYVYQQQIAKETIINRNGKQKEFTLLHTNQNLPIAFTSDTYISTSAYNKMTAVEKQQALLQGIVVEDGNNKSITFTDERKECLLQPEDGIEIKDHTIFVSKKNAVLTISFNGAADCETYFVIEGLDYKEDSKKCSIRTPLSEVQLKIKCGKIEKKLTYLNNRDNFYCGINDFLVNMGFREKAVNQLKIHFSDKGRYSFEDLYVICQPVSQISSYAENMKKESLQNLSIEGNRIWGTVDVSKKKLICMTIPYSRGWSAYVDGKETTIKRADTAFMAFETDKGIHQIELKYVTPYLKEGTIISILGIVGWIILVICRKKL